MHCLRLSGSESVCTYFREHENIACGLRVALAAIVACGLVLSICSIVSYLPPSAGYCGCISSLLSLVTLAICTICRKRNQIPDSSDVAKQPMMPSEILIAYIFSRLDGYDLTRASRVCKDWYLSASDNRLWENPCLQEVIAPPEGQILDLYDYKAMYQHAKESNNRIRKGIPKGRKITISAREDNNGFPCQAEAFLKTKNRVFLYSGRFTSGRFEMWDPSLSKCLFAISTLSFSPRAEIKCVGNSVYLIGSICHTNPIYYVYHFEIENDHLKLQREWVFEGVEKWHLRETQFELGDQKAFIGQKDGVIDIVDLISEGVIHTCLALAQGEENMLYSEQSDWNPEAERSWEASFAKTDLVWGEKIGEDGVWRPLQMEEGESERNMMENRRNNHLAIQQRKRLSEHTDAITALRIAGNYLLSSSNDGTIKQWDLSNCTCIQTIVTGFKTGASLLQVAGRYVFGLVKEVKNTIWPVGSCNAKMSLSN